MTERQTRLILIRHGEVESNYHGRIYGDLDVPLSITGRQQSKAAAARLETRQLVSVVSSGLERAEFLAQQLRSSRGLPRRVDPRLREIHRGQWAGLDRAAIEARWPGRWERFRRSSSLLAPPGGEAITHVRARVRHACLELARCAPGGTVAICAHRWVLASMACTARGWPLDLAAEVPLDYCAQLELEWDPDAATLREVALLGAPA